VCSGATGHAEAVQIEFDPKVVSYRELLEVFFSFHNPTTLNRQGADTGTQYRSAIFYHSPEQKSEAEAAICEIVASGVWDGPVVTSLEAHTGFYPAEDYHQEYYSRNPGQPYCQAVIEPKLRKLRAKYLSRLKS
jgi:peptide-methionine (S)-S-oxide reductase